MGSVPGVVCLAGCCNSLQASREYFITRNHCRLPQGRRATPTGACSVTLSTYRYHLQVPRHDAQQLLAGHFAGVVTSPEAPIHNSHRCSVDPVAGRGGHAGHEVGQGHGVEPWALQGHLHSTTNRGSTHTAAARRKVTGPVTPPPSTNISPTLPSVSPPKLYLVLVLRDTLCSCEAYGMRPTYKGKKA